MRQLLILLLWTAAWAAVARYLATRPEAPR